MQGLAVQTLSSNPMRPGSLPLHVDLPVGRDGDWYESEGGYVVGWV